MTETEKKFISVYEKHQRTIPDYIAIAEELGYTKNTVRTLIWKYKKKGLIR